MTSARSGQAERAKRTKSISCLLSLTLGGLSLVVLGIVLYRGGWAPVDDGGLVMVARVLAIAGGLALVPAFRKSRSVSLGPAADGESGRPGREGPEDLRAEIERLREALDRASAETRRKAEFVTSLSHEIRTPMNGIIGMTRIALGTELTEEQRDSLTVVRDSADSLLALLNDVLDFLTLEAGRLTLVSTAFDLRDRLSKALKPLSSKAAENGVELLNLVHKNVPNFLVGDPYRLRQVLVNLVDNSMRVTEPGQIRFEAREDRREGDTVVLHIKVSSTGEGIPDGRLEQVFELLSGEDAPSTRIGGGAGLGLAISARIVERMGGRIWAESSAGEGSSFHFTASFQICHHPPGCLTAASLERLRDLSVLVVDDNPTNRRVLEDILTGWRMRPTLVSSSREAIEILRQKAAEGESFGLVLVDQLMPEMNGFEFVERVQEEFPSAGPVVMMLSSYDGPRRALSGEGARIRGFFLKPVNESDLLNAVQGALEEVGRAARGGEARDEERGEAIESSNDVALDASVEARTDAARAKDGDGRTPRVLLAEDNIVNQKVAVGLLEKLGCEVTLVTNGLEAVDSVENEDFALVFMDVQMPEMGGIEATEEIRRRESAPGRRVPIVAMTAHALKGDRERCLSAGMDAYISKPIRAQDLRSVLDRFVRPESHSPA